jgi:hypothetical protein
MSSFTYVLRVDVDGENSFPVPAEAIRRLAEPFFEEGATEVYVAYCCMYVFVGSRAPTTCHHCKKAVTSQIARSVEEAARLGT